MSFIPNICACGTVDTKGNYLQLCVRQYIKHTNLVNHVPICDITIQTSYTKMFIVDHSKQSPTNRLII